MDGWEGVEWPWRVGNANTGTIVRGVKSAKCTDTEKSMIACVRWNKNIF